jgi:hypothetical protein
VLLTEQLAHLVEDVVGERGARELTTFDGGGLIASSSRQRPCEGAEGEQESEGAEREQDPGDGVG